MPNIASILKDEIVRLARKEVRNELEGLKKASALYRAEIIALKRRVDGLEKRVPKIEKKAPLVKVAEVPEGETTPVRFSAKGLASHRQRLELSAASLATLLGVSPQTIHNWEAGKSRPRPQQLAAISALRKMGKQQAMAHLEGKKA